MMGVREGEREREIPRWGVKEVIFQYGKERKREEEQDERPEREGRLDRHERERERGSE